jgi:hypothetical protein
VQVQIGSHSFTFDHVYGSTGKPSAAMFDECVAPLVDGLFQGYNATVLAYGQVGIHLLRQFSVVFDYHVRPRPCLNYFACIPCAIDAAKRDEKLGPPRWGLAHGKSQQQHVAWCCEGHPIACSVFFLSFSTTAVCAMMMGSSICSRNPKMLIISARAPCLDRWIWILIDP